MNGSSALYSAYFGVGVGPGDEVICPTYTWICTIGPALLRANLAYFDALEQRCRAALERGAPASPPDDADVEALAAFPFEEAIPPGVTVTQPEFYRPGHQKHIRLMLAHLASR